MLRGQQPLDVSQFFLCDQIPFSFKYIQLENCCTLKHPFHIVKFESVFPLILLQEFHLHKSHFFVIDKLLFYSSNFLTAHGSLIHQWRIHCLNEFGISTINNTFSATSPLLKSLLQLIFLCALHTHNSVRQNCELKGCLLSKTMRKLWSTQFLSELHALQSSPNINL